MAKASSENESGFVMQGGPWVKILSALFRPGWANSILAISFMATIHLAVVSNIVHPGYIPYTKDDQSFVLHHSIFLQQSIAAGDFPLWNPYLQYGTPELFQFHPLTLLVHALASDGLMAYKIFTYLPGLLTGIGAWLFLGLFLKPACKTDDGQTVKQNSDDDHVNSSASVVGLVRFLGALMIMYSPFAVSYITLPQVLLSYAHIPFLFYLAEWLYRNPFSRMGYFGLSLTTGLLLLSVLPHTILYGLLGVCVYFTGRILLAKATKSCLRPIILFALFILLGIGIGIVGLLLFVVLRSQWDPGFAALYQNPDNYLVGLKPRDILTYFTVNLPDIHLESSSFSSYNNTLPTLSLGILLYLRRPSRAHIGLIVLVLTAISYFVALGRYNPAYVWLTHYLPFFMRLDGPNRIMLIAGTMLPLLSCLGFSSLLAYFDKEKRDVTSAALLVAAFALVVLFTEYFCSKGTEGREWIYLLYGAAVMLIALGCLWINKSMKQYLSMAGIAVLILAVPITVRLMLPSLLSSKHMVSADLLKAHPSMDYFGRSDTLFRYSADWSEPQEWIKYAYHNKATWSRLVPDMQLAYKRYGTGTYMTATKHHGNEFNNTATMTELREKTSNLSMLRMSSVKWIISDRAYENERLKLLGTISDGNDQTFYYEVPDPLPRAFIPAEVYYLPGKSARVPVKGMDFDPKERAVISAGPSMNKALSGQSIKSGPGKVSIVKYENRRVELAANMESSGWVILNDTFFPGWKAVIDNKPVEIHQANYLFRAVPVPAGAHNIVFEYAPIEFKLGLLSMVICLGAAAFLAWTSTYFLKGSRMAIQVL